MGKKVIIDCDVGVDDALALILAFHSPEIQVKAVTGVNGNIPLDVVFKNIKKVLSLIRPSEKPVIAKGADRPLLGRSAYARSVHGESGLGEAKIEITEGEAWWDDFTGAADLLTTKIARQYPGEVTLIATGPLTNVALGLQRDPEGMKKMKEIVCMGGAVRTRGNITPHAEFNIYSDPLAARIVFESGTPVILVPLDVTHQGFLTSQIIEERIKPRNNPFSSFLVEAIGYDSVGHRFRRGSEVAYLHDPLAVGVVIDPRLVKRERPSIHVETGEGDRFGETLESQEGKPIEVCLEVDARRFLELFLSRLG